MDHLVSDQQIGKRAARAVSSRRTPYHQILIKSPPARSPKPCPKHSSSSWWCWTGQWPGSWWSASGKTKWPKLPICARRCVTKRMERKGRMKESQAGRSYKSTTWCLDWDKGFGNGQMAYGVFTCCASPEAGSLVPFVSILTSFRCHKVGLKNLSLRF